MDITLCVLADYANVTQENKLNILGIFSILRARQFPTVHPQMQLVMEFTADPAEAGRVRNLEIQLRNADGKTLGRMQTKAEFKAGAPGEPLRGHHIVTLNSVRFDAPGNYEFVVLIDNDVRENKPLKVIRLPETPPQRISDET